MIFLVPILGTGCPQNGDKAGRLLSLSRGGGEVFVHKEEPLVEILGPYPLNPIFL